MPQPTTVGATSDEAVARLEQQLITLLRLGNLPRVHERLVERASTRIDRGALVVLARIGDEGPIRLSDLARLLALDVSTASRHAARLCESGLLERRTDDRDHRAMRLSLSERGRTTLDEIRAARHDAFVELLSPWRARDIQRLATDLERLNTVLAERAGIDEGDDG